MRRPDRGALCSRPSHAAPGGLQDKNEKNRPSLKSLKTDSRLEKSKYKPLCGKIFYLDLPSITVCEKLQKDIKDLGGIVVKEGFDFMCQILPSNGFKYLSGHTQSRVEEFLSKDISYLVSNKKEAKYAQTLGQNSPVPSPESAYTAETTSPHPSHDGSSFKSPDRVCLSRGKLLAEKAVKDHDFIPANSILSNALSWGVKILHIDGKIANLRSSFNKDIRYYIEQKKKELCTLKKSSTSVRDVHLLSEKHRNFAQSNQYQLVDDIVSKLVFDFVEYEKDTPKKKRIKYSIGSLSSASANVLRNTEPKEMLPLEPVSQDMGGSNGKLLEQNFQYEETQEPEQKLVFASEPMSYCSTGLKRQDEKTMSMFNASEPDLPPCKNEQEGTLVASEHKLITNKNDSVEQEDDSPGVPQSCVQVSYLSTENSTPQPKLTADIIHSSANHPQHDSDLVTLNTSKEHLTMKARTPSCSPQEPNECDTENMDDLPCGKIRRKVRLLLRQKIKNVDPSAELDKKRTELLPTCEDRICGSQSLLDLFQTSGEKSEFLGFTSYTENSGMCDVLDIWEEENSSSLLSSFFSSPSASTFVGF
ncbi:hypothetical protein STEG23_030532 [Scotinomys teguina]